MLLLRNIFLNPKGLWALLAVAAFVIFYIIRPKPKKVMIPSLMFLIKDKSNSNFNSFLQKFFKDFLFYIQLIILLLIASSVAKPYISILSISYADNMVFVIDASASMNAIEDGKTRFDKAIEYSINNVKNRNTIILATDRSQLILENQGRTETIKILRSLKATHSPAYNFYDSVVLAENFALGDNSAVFVVSDFSTDRVENEFLMAKIYLESKGIDVFFEKVSLNKAQNVGIIHLEVKDEKSTIWIKNFMNIEKTINVKYGEIREVVNIESNDVKSITFTTLPGNSIIELEVKDDFIIDDKAYISMPEEASMNILMIANENEPFLETALNLISKVSINIQRPPIINFGEPNLIILGKINKDLIIPGDIRKIKSMVEEQGIPLIILAQDNILDLDLGDLIPFEIIRREPVIGNELVIPTRPGLYLTPSEIQFGQVGKFYQSRNIDDIITYAHVSTNKYPIIAMYTYGSGRVLYYGIFDEYSEFKSDIYYPVFWKRALDLLIGGKSIGEINKKTGYMQVLNDNAVVRTPEGMRTGRIITLDYSGFYNFNDFTIAANLLNEEEQRLNRPEINLERSNLNYQMEKSVRSTKNKELSYLFILLATLFLIFELLYIKFRGDV
jgi:hypothetical protein